MKFGQYLQYTPSGIPWLPEVPASWEILKVSSFAEENKTKNKGNLEGNVLSLSYGQIIRKHDINAGLTPADYSTYQIVDKDNIILRLTDLQNDHKSLRCGLVRERGIITNAYVGLKIKSNKVLPEFVYLMLHCYDILKVFYSMGDGLRQTMNYTDVSRLYLPIPSLSEQRIIVDYVASKRQKIDGLIFAKKEKLELLKELKESVILKAATEGIESGRNNRACQLSWLPSVPETWEVKRLGSYFTDDVSTNKNFEFTRAFKFNYGALVPKNETGDPSEYRDVYVKYSVLKKDDILINGLNLNYDFVSQRVAQSPSDGIITSAYIALRPRHGVNSDYFTFLLKAMDYRKLFHGMGTGIRLTLSFSELKTQLLPVPPQEEQEEIVAYINDKVGKINAMMAAVEKDVELLNELKQRLIADVVTGQRKVAEDADEYKRRRP